MRSVPLFLVFYGVKIGPKKFPKGAPPRLWTLGDPPTGHWSFHVLSCSFMPFQAPCVLE